MGRLLFQTVGGKEGLGLDLQETRQQGEERMLMSLGEREYEKRPATATSEKRAGESIEMSTTSTKYRDNLGNVYEVVQVAEGGRSASESPHKTATSPEINIRFLHHNNSVGKTLQKAIRFIGIRGREERLLTQPRNVTINSPFNLPACFPQMIPHQHIKHNLMQMQQNLLHGGIPE